MIAPQVFGSGGNGGVNHLVFTLRLPVLVLVYPREHLRRIMASAYDKFNVFVQGRREEYTREFILGSPEPEPPIDVLPTLGLQAGGPGNMAIRAVLEGPAHRRRSPNWYHQAALYVHPDRVLAKLYRSMRAASSSPASTGDPGLPALRSTIDRWKKLSNSMMQDVNGLVASVDDDDHHHGEGGPQGDNAEDLPALRGVLKMAAEGHDLEMAKDYARRHRHWHSVKTQYVSARVDNAVARIDHRSRGTLSEAEAKTEIINGFIDRIAIDIGREDDDQRIVD